MDYLIWYMQLGMEKLVVGYLKNVRQTLKEL